MGFLDEEMEDDEFEDVLDYNEPLFPFDEDEENMGEDNFDNEIDKLNDLKERFDFLKINSNDSSFSTDFKSLYDEDIISYSKMNFYNNVLNFIFSNLEIKTLNDFVDCIYNSLEFVIIDDKKKFKNSGNILKLFEILDLKLTSVFKFRLHNGWGMKFYKKDCYEVRVYNSDLRKFLENTNSNKFIENLEKAKKAIDKNFNI